MPRRITTTRKALLQHLEEKASTPQILRVDTRKLVHARSSTAGECPCCGSSTAKIVDEGPDLSLMIDTRDGFRLLRHAADPVEFDEVTAGLPVVDVPLKCSERAEPFVFDSTTRTLLATGAARSSKTQHMVVWSFRQWMLRGGVGSIAWFIAPELQLAMMLRDKWCIGEDGGKNAPVCPRELIVSYPQNERAADMHIHMIDGTRIRLVHAHGDGGNLPGRSIAWWIMTEAAVIKDPKNYARARGRLVSSGGQGAMDAVPEPRGWIKRAIVDAAALEDERERDAATRGEVFRRTVKCWHFPTVANPWINEQEAEDFVADLMRLDPRLAAREAGGQYVGDTPLLFEDVFDQSIHTFSSPAVAIPDGLVDVTDHASRRWFYAGHRWVAAVDVNFNPHTAVMVRVAVTDAKHVRDPSQWILVVCDELQTWRDQNAQRPEDPQAGDSEQAAALLAGHRSGRYAGCGVVMDATSTYKTRAAGGGHARRSGSPKAAYENAGFEVRGPDKHRSTNASGQRTYKNPDRYDSAVLLRTLMRENRLLVNRYAAPRMIRAIMEIATEPDGITPEKLRGQDQDRHIGSMIDCLRYVAWALMQRPEAGNDAHPRASVH